MCFGTLVACEDVYNSYEWVKPLPFLEDGCLYHPTLLVDYGYLEGDIPGAHDLPSSDPLTSPLMLMQWVAPTARELFISHCSRLEKALVQLTSILLESHPGKPLYIPPIVDPLIVAALAALENMASLMLNFDGNLQTLLRMSIPNTSGALDFVVRVDEALSTCLEKEVIRGCGKALVPYVYLATTLFVKIQFKTPSVLYMFRPLRHSYFLSALQYRLEFLPEPPEWPLVIITGLSSAHVFGFPVDSLEIPLFHDNPPERAKPNQSVSALLSIFGTIFSTADSEAPGASELVWKLLTIADTFELLSHAQTQLFCTNPIFVDWLLNHSELRYATTDMRARRVITVFFRICKSYVTTMPLAPRISIVRTRMLSVGASPNKREALILDCGNFEASMNILGSPNAVLSRFSPVRVDFDKAARCMQCLMDSLVAPDWKPITGRTLGRLRGLLLLYEDPGDHLRSLILSRQEKYPLFKDAVSLGNDEVLKGFCDMTACSILSLALPRGSDVVEYIDQLRAIRRRLEGFRVLREDQEEVWV